MNRRELFSALGLTAVAGGTAKASDTTSPIRLRSENNFIDLTPIANRISGYKNYERILQDSPKLFDELVEKSVEIAENLYVKFNLKNHWMNQVTGRAKRFNSFHLRLIVQSLATYGDYFAELVIDPEDKTQRTLAYIHLGCDSMYRIETIKGKLLEFQQSKEGPDYEAVARCPIDEAGKAKFCSAAIRFSPEQIIHIRAGGFAKGHYPYGVSAIRTGKVEMGYAFKQSAEEGIQELVRRFD